MNPRRRQADPIARWTDGPLGAIRVEAHHHDRVVRCFAQRPASLWAMFADASAHRAEHEALVADGRRWTWRALAADVDALAGGLAARGIGAGERVALFLPNRAEFVIALFAIQKLGAIAVPIGIREQRPGLAYMLGQCGAAALLYDAALAERVPAASDLAVLRLRVVVGGDAPPDGGDVAYRDLSAGGASVPAAPVAEEDTAVILYTSGTTGHPKGAMLTHLSIVHSALHFRYGMRLGPDDRGMLAVPASHVTGLVALIASTVLAGGALVVLPEFRAGPFLQAMADERATFTILVPAMYNLCVLQPEFDGAALRHWRIAGFGGAPMPESTIAALAERLPRLVLVNAYGATETSSPATMMPLGRNNDHPESVGVPLPCVDLIVVDDDGREVPPGEAGELWIGGPMVVAGYWDNPQATRDAFTAGYWHSGDVGLVDADGYVRVFDRKKDMLNRGGFKVYSVEVENTLVAHPGVVEAAVVGRPCPVLGERVHAFVHAPRAGLDEAVLRAYCAARLADYKVPESIVFSDEPLPRNANGKLLKRVLRERLAG